jgi:hypothetical protein
MIDVNSNCSRVDAVKSMASQLKMQAAQLPHSNPADDNYHKVQAKLETVDTAVKKNDARQAENALSTAKSALNQVQTQSSATPGSGGLLNVYA